MSGSWGDPQKGLRAHNSRLTSARCVLLGLCPQFLDPTLRTTQHPVDEQSVVGVGRHLGRDPGNQPHQRGGQGLPQTEGPLQARKAKLDLLPSLRRLASRWPRCSPARSPTRPDPPRGPHRGRPDPPRACGGYLLSQLRLLQKLRVLSWTPAVLAAVGS